MLFEAIPLLFFYLFTSVFSGAKCSIAAVSSGLPPLFHSMEFLLPAFLRTADPGLLFFQENSFCTFLIHRFYRLYGKNSAVLRLFHPDFSFHHTVFRDMLQDTDNSAVLRKTSGSFSSTSGGTSCRQHLSPASPPSPLPLSQTSVIRTSYTPGTAV